MIKNNEYDINKSFINKVKKLKTQNKIDELILKECKKINYIYPNNQNLLEILKNSKLKIQWRLNLIF